MTEVPRSLRLVVTFVAIVAGMAGMAVLPACGSDPHYTGAPGGRVHVHLSEYRVTPEHIQVRAGRITIEARNTGRVTHNLAVVQFAHPTSAQDERAYGKPTPTLFPGQTGGTTVALKPGKYRLVCTIANHDNLGQYGELKVTGR